MKILLSTMKHLFLNSNHNLSKILTAKRCLFIIIELMEVGTAAVILKYYAQKDLDESIIAYIL